MLPAKDWAVQQWAQVKLGDQRLNRRAVEIGAHMAADPAASLPHQMRHPARLKATYRFLNNRAVTLRDLIAPHCERTLQAARRLPLVLMVEDTTELNYGHHAQTTGLGPIGNGKGHGLLLHSTLGVVPETRMVLGLVHIQSVLREPLVRTHIGWSSAPEGRVWANSAQVVGAPPPGVQWVHVSDRGSDIFEYMVACREHGKHFLLRACHNRALKPTDALTPLRLIDYARRWSAQPGRSYRVTVPAHAGQPARQADLVLHWEPITVKPPPQAPRPLRYHAPLPLWLLRAWEPTPPAQGAPLEWILLSSMPITDLEAAYERLAWYTCRWLAEDYHQCLKTGCQVEQSQLDDGADLQRLLGFAAPIAVRLLQLRQTARQTPTRPATTVVEPLMVQTLARHQKLDPDTLTLEQFWRTVAQLGGHQGRRSDGPPGWRTLWRGWRYLSELTEGARLFGQPNTS